MARLGRSYAARPIIKSAGGAANGLNLFGPSSGVVNVGSAPFTVVANGVLNSTVTVTPTDSSGNGTFAPTTVNLTGSNPAKTFIYTPTTGGTRNINVTNNGGLTNPANIVYTAGTSVTVKLCVSPTDSTAVANQTGLKWASFDQVTPDLLNAPTDKGSTGTTDSSGIMNLLLPNSTKTSGQTVFLIVSNSDGTPTQSPPAQAFADAVVVN